MRIHPKTNKRVKQNKINIRVKAIEAKNSCPKKKKQNSAIKIDKKSIDITNRLIKNH